MGKTTSATKRVVCGTHNGKELSFKISGSYLRCKWFLKCEEPATTTVPHPILGDVPTCQQCANTVEANS